MSEWDCVRPLIGLNPTLLAEFISIKKRTLPFYKGSYYPKMSTKLPHTQPEPPGTKRLAMAWEA